MNRDCKTVGFFFAGSLAKAPTAESVAHSYDQRKKYDCFAVYHKQVWRWKLKYRYSKAKFASSKILSLKVQLKKMNEHAFIPDICVERILLMLELYFQLKL